MNENTNTQQLTPDATPAGTGGRMFTQAEVNKIVSDRLTREREKLADEDSYRAKYESVLAELNGLKAAQLHQKKEDAYRALLEIANISAKRIPIVMRSSGAEIDALELDGAGKVVGADKVIASIQKNWDDFIVSTTIVGADTPNPPYNTGNSDKIADAFKPKI